MSTLKACKADGFYRPNDYDPTIRQKEIEKKRKEGTLKVRVQGARKIRFEMPFHIRCTECKKMVAKGVRFNSVQKKAGRYLGTLIFTFTMPCPNCKNTFIIKTDPKNCEYLLVKGCVKYVDDYIEEKDVDKIQTPEEGEKLNRNPFLKLESQKEDIIIGELQKPILLNLIEEKKILKNDFFVNQTLRRKLKMEKSLIKKEEMESKSKGLDIKLLPVNTSDIASSLKAKFRYKDNRFNIRDTIRHESIFKNNSFYQNKNLQETNIFLQKKHRLDKSVQIALEREIKNKSIMNINSVMDKSNLNFSSSLKLNNCFTNIKIKK